MPRKHLLAEPCMFGYCVLVWWSRLSDVIYVRRFDAAANNAPAHPRRLDWIFELGRGELLKTSHPYLYSLLITRFNFNFNYN